MPITLDQLIGSIQPERTVLVMGAGAAVSSGAPTGAALSKLLGQELPDSDLGDDLMETASIYENRHGRPKLIAAVRKRLEKLQPSGGLQALALHRWASIYSTNFDRLIEISLRLANRDFHVIRSNYDFGPATASDAVKLYKIHGCITQDAVDGSKSKMLLTQRDYDEFEKFRESLFAGLKFEMLTKDTLIIGQSLRDPHLKAMADNIARIHSSQGTQSRVLLLAYDEDADRALLFEQKGIQVAFGSLDQFAERLVSDGPLSEEPDQLVGPSGTLPPRVVATTVDIAQALQHAPNAHRLFHGGPASYADIRYGLTITRSVEAAMGRALADPGKVAIVITGAAGVGKTTLARRLLFSQAQSVDYAWEHQSDFPLHVDGWVSVEQELRAQGKTGLLLVDDCSKFLSGLTRIVDHLGAQESPAIRVVLTAHSSQWDVRSKSPMFFSRGARFRISRLDSADLDAFLALVDTQPDIHALVEPSFAMLSRQQQVRQLRERCSSEMFVCLKNVFATERLDDILLREFADLVPEAQDIYRHVAVLQSMGGRVHRQLIVRLLGVDGGHLSSLLSFLDDVVIEQDIKPEDGLFGWSTRHTLIAEVIATYKFADEKELVSLLERIVSGLNPSLALEVETARSIASSDFGVGRVVSEATQLDLLRKISAVIPAERVPRRRLIRKLLDLGRVEEADLAIRQMREDIGQDSVCDRYRVRLAVMRAEDTHGIMESDRIAMMDEAERIARRCVRDSPGDKHAYSSLAMVATARVRRHGMSDLAIETVGIMKRAEEWILDPELARNRRRLEQLVSDYSSGQVIVDPAEFDPPEDDLA